MSAGEDLELRLDEGQNTTCIFSVYREMKCCALIISTNFLCQVQNRKSAVVHSISTVHHSLTLEVQKILG